MTDILDTMKRPHLWILGIEEELQAKEIEKIFNKIIEEKFPNLVKDILIQVAWGTQNIK